jgi:hypothetical protein
MRGIKKIFRGKYFDSDLVDETLEIIPTNEVKGTLVFYKSEAKDMKVELTEILKRAKQIKMVKK